MSDTEWVIGFDYDGTTADPAMRLIVLAMNGDDALIAASEVLGVPSEYLRVAPSDAEVS